MSQSGVANSGFFLFVFFLWCSPVQADQRSLKYRQSIFWIGKLGKVCLEHQSRWAAMLFKYKVLWSSNPFYFYFFWCIWDWFSPTAV